jgi:hypothetical protein
MNKFIRFFRDKEMTIFFTLWAVYAVFCVFLTGAALYVAYHFISKYW